MSHTEFLDESAFSLKIGGIEINPQTGDGIEGILKLAGWTVEKTSGNDLIFSYDGTEKLRLPSVGDADIGGSYSEYVYTATADQTTFTGSDNFGTTLSYSPGKAVVFMNGVRMAANVDFTATDGTSVVFTDGTSASDIIMIQSF